MYHGYDLGLPLELPLNQLLPRSTTACLRTTIPISTTIYVGYYDVYVLKERKWRS